MDKGYPFDVIEAVVSTSFGELLDAQHRIDALRGAREWKDFESIVIGFKRAMNILKGAPSPKEIKPSLFLEDGRENLHQSFLKGKEKIDLYLNKKDYESSLLEMTEMKKPIDEFFDKVMVMVEDENIRNNRLAMLNEIGRLFLKIADFSKLT